MLKKLYFIQDEAAPYTVISSKYVLSNIFQDRLMCMVFSIIRPPYSPDLTPIDFWLWPKLKAIIFSKRHKPLTSVRGLKLAIMHAFRRLQSENFDHIVVLRRMSSCFAKNGFRLKNSSDGDYKMPDYLQYFWGKKHLIKICHGPFS